MIISVVYTRVCRCDKCMSVCKVREYVRYERSKYLYIYGTVYRFNVIYVIIFENIDTMYLTLALIIYIIYFQVL